MTSCLPRIKFDENLEEKINKFLDQFGVYQSDPLMPKRLKTESGISSPRKLNSPLYIRRTKTEMNIK